ncbi:hypothetical protein [Rubrolithibacter danxiaensis]|uniref:hypothetical protein n=1 Tax=Rubrolithibacter danxiaensis TaxID=3390805 RepID=UPI003BF7C7D8
MKDFEALKNIWSGQVEQSEINPEDVLKKVRKTKRSFSNKLLLETAGMLFVILLFAFIWISTPFMMWTTHLAMAIFMGCCLYYLFVQFQDYRSISNAELLLKQPQEFINYLQAYKKERYILNTRKYKLYSLFIGIAFGLYFIEVYFLAPLWQTLLGVIFTIAWFLICWFLMKIYIKREEEKLEEMMNSLSRLKKQFEAE